VYETVFDTRGFPPDQRFARWREMADQSSAAAVVSSDHARDFAAHMRVLDLGAAQVCRLCLPSLRSHRTTKLVRRRDPRTYFIALAPQDGAFELTHAGRHTVLHPPDLVMYSSSYPFAIRVAATNGRWAGVTVAQVPQSRLALPSGCTDRLLGRKLSGADGPGFLLRHFLTTMTGDAGRYLPTDGPRLEPVLVNLVTAAVAHELDDLPAEPRTHHEVLLTRIQAFIHRHLSDPALSPARVAEANHVSRRQLNRLFQEHGMTVAGWIRDRRLECCHRDLADPGQRDRPISGVAARWGFPDPAHFSRVFRAAYAMSPLEHRERATGGFPGRAAEPG
jgi:AraC-like DNA-binding protein